MKLLLALLCSSSLLLGISPNGDAAYGIDVKLVWTTYSADLDLEIYPPYALYPIQESHLEAGYNLNYNGCFWYTSHTPWGCRYNYDSRGGRSYRDTYPYAEEATVNLAQMQANPGRYIIAVRHYYQSNYAYAPNHVRANIEIYYFGEYVGSFPVVLDAPGDVKIVWEGVINDDSSGFIPQHDLTIQRLGNGDGIITSQDAGIQCGADCTENYTQHTTVTLTATPIGEVEFMGWSGDCAGTQTTTTVDMTTARTCRAEFTRRLSNCRLYGVQDNRQNDSQLFLLNLDTGMTQALGTELQAVDLEGLDTQVETQMLYASSGNNTSQAGHLYQINPNTGATTMIGATGFREVDSLSFSRDGHLWGWAKGSGLIQIATETGLGTLQLASEVLVEDMSWHPDGTALYAVEQDNLWTFDGQTATLLCQLPGAAEALETLPDGRLLFSLGEQQAGVYQIDVASCISTQLLATPFLYDIEGLAWRCEP